MKASRFKYKLIKSQIRIKGKTFITNNEIFFGELSIFTLIINSYQNHMLIILSPAKTMDMTRNNTGLLLTRPKFEKDAGYLAKIMRKYSVEELGKLLKISKPLAEENYKRYQQFDREENPGCQALLAYNGSVFKEIRVSTFTEQDFEYAQSHLRIISTLYGLVRPLDTIKAYRLAYLPGLQDMKEKNLYEYWRPKLTVPLIEDIRKAGGILINLASLDVLGALNMEKIDQEVEIITPEFQEYRNGKYETIRTYAKQARGAMTRYILLNRIKSPEKMKEFEWEGFRFNETISDTGKYIFSRKNKRD